MTANNSENIKIDRIKNIVLSIGFVAILVFPAFQEYFTIIPESESTENRMLAEKPIVNFNNLDYYPSRYEKYYNDNFSLRNQMVGLRSLIIGKTFQMSPLPDKVIFGKEDWLFSVKNELDLYRGTNLLSEKDVDRITNEILYRKNYLDKKNIGLYFVIVPTKYTVYPEYLPNAVDKLNRITRTDQVVQALRENSIDVLDLRDTLINAKNNDLLYYKTDNHWNALGCFIGCRSIINTIKKDYPEIPALNLADYNITLETRGGGNAAEMINMQSDFSDIGYVLMPKVAPMVRKVPNYGYPVPQYFPYLNEYEMVYETANDSLPNLLFIRDSFGNSAIPFIRHRFNRSVFIFDNWLYRSNEHIIENEQPDIVVYMVLESFWDNFIKGIDYVEPQSK